LTPQVRRIYIPLPDVESRMALIRHALKKQKNSLSERDLARLARETEGYSGSDLAALCRDAAMMPLRELGAAVATVAERDVRGVSLRDFFEAKAAVRPSVDAATLRAYDAFNAAFGAQG
jgi:SpoVK/Ycf46/Vps4 family AAA+-type ATPase